MTSRSSTATSGSKSASTVSGTTKDSVVKSNSTATSHSSSSSRAPTVSKKAQASSVFLQCVAEDEEAFLAYLTRRQKNKERLLKHQQEYNNIEGNLDRIKILEGKISEKEAEIQTLKSSSKTQWEEFETRCAEKKELEKENRQLKQSLSDVTARVDEAEDKVAKLRGASKELADERRKTIALDRKLIDQGSELGSLRRQLGDWNSYISDLAELEGTNLHNNLQNLFKLCYGVASNYFNTDLPGGLLSDQSRWDRLRRDLTQAVPVPLPPINSQAAKLCRMAAALHIIGSNMATDIFKPCYFHETVESNDAIKEVLHQQRFDEKKQAVTRASLLLYPTEVLDNAIDRTVKKTVEKVTRILSPLLGNQTESFRTELAELFGEAVSVWRRTHRSREMIEASIHGDEYAEWMYLSEFGDPDKPHETPETPSADFAPLPLFPHVYIPERRNIHAGIALWSDQKAVIVAKEQCRKSLAKRPENRLSMNSSDMNATLPNGSPR